MTGRARTAAVRRPGPPTTAEQHRAWLELVDTEGPFLSVPVLSRVWSTGMPPLRERELSTVRDAKPAFEKAWERWDEARDEPSLDAYREARDAWVRTVLGDVLGWRDAYADDPAATVVRSPAHEVAVGASGAYVRDGDIGALVLVVDPVDSLRADGTDGWAASPVDRMDELLRAAGVAVGVVTDGRWWAVVSAPAEGATASGIVDAQTWIEEPATRNAFAELLRPKRLLGGRPEDRLPVLFAESVLSAEAITEALGIQVRKAVELLVQALSESAATRVRDGGDDPLPADRGEVYDAAVTVMMRVVFLLFAEERGLLPEGVLFEIGYGIRGEFDRLDQLAFEAGGSEPLDATHMTWHRLLAVSRALYGGASFEDVRLPSYGGSLFDPARFPFLTATDEHGRLAVTVSDRVLLEVLRAVQVANPKGEPARRISFRDVDVEQIGYIYEGLLGYTARRADETTIGLVGRDGEEPEIPLATLEGLAERAGDDPNRLAEAILTHVDHTQPAAKPPTKAALAKAYRTSHTVEDAERALRAVTTDEALRDRLRPYVGIIRRDLRNRPFVVHEGGVLVVETPSRATAGAHYTPRSLAEEVVRYALEPLCFDPGPHQTADRDAWRPVSSDDLLELKIADIACGSGAFLVAAARYLGARLVEAWQREEVARGDGHDETRAIRQVVSSCLYGADINAMAVEMCKLSLWLVSLDPRLPFSFVDDKVLLGNSLLGLTDVRQLELMHVDPAKAPQQPRLTALDVDGVLRDARRLRERLATVVDDRDPSRSSKTKRRLWREYQERTAQLTDVADGVIAAGLRLGGKPGKKLDEAYENLRLAVEAAYPANGQLSDRTMLDAILAAGLTPTVPTDYARWKPLHWVLAVPDVMGRGGFDAVVGNPPFLGGKKISPAYGTDIREWLVNVLAGGAKGNGDLVASFFVRAMSLLTPRGDLGLIATNTVAQGDTRETGLDRMVDAGLTITRAIQSRSWPTKGANLEFAGAWGTRGAVEADVPRISDGEPVARISTLLEPAGRIDGRPERLAENLRIAFQGCIVLGMGFVIDPEEAAAWIKADPRNAEVLRPYLNGEDLNSRPDSSPSRWVVDFQERSADDAARYALPWARLQAVVRPERIIKDASKYPRMVNEWWKFWNGRPAMRRAIANLDELLVTTRVSDVGLPTRVGTGLTFSDRLAVIASRSYSLQAILSSSLHLCWLIKYGTTHEARLTYGPTAVFETFPQSVPTEQLDAVGRTLDTERREIMLRRQLGLTKLYNLVNAPEVADAADPDVARMREIHVELDRTVMDAYGWGDVALDHGFHVYRQMRRWTVSPQARVEILDRLLEENHRRAAAQGETPPVAPSDDDPDE